MAIRYFFPLFLLVSSTCALADYDAAGIIAYACKDGSALYLLAYDPHKRRKAWGILGGGKRSSDANPWQTAKREFSEETNCLYTQKELDKSTRRNGPSESNSFESFVLEVEHKPIQRFSESRKCNNVERSFWVWVPHDSLMAALKHRYHVVEIAGPPITKFYLWHEAARSIEKAIDAGHLSANDPCGSRAN